MKKSNVIVLLEVYNEEDRIELCLKNFLWADSVILIDKGSTDLTVKIAKKFATEVIRVPYGSKCSSYWKEILSKINTSEWVMAPTASSLIHPNLVKDIITLTTDANFNYDVIGMPYAIHAFGIISDKSPWHGKRKYTLIRKSALILTDKVHHEFYSDSTKRYDMPIKNKVEVLYHLTHRSLDDYFEKTIRYAKAESDQGESSRGAIYSIFKSIFTVMVRRRTIWMKKNGLALSLLYVGNFVMIYLRTWEKKLNINDYHDIKREIDNDWNEVNKSKNCKKGSYD